MKIKEIEKNIPVFGVPECENINPSFQSTVRQGNNLQNVTQNNEHGKNIYAHTVTVNECPQELIELLIRLVKNI